jgi:hypothetical protein
VRTSGGHDQLADSQTSPPRKLGGYARHHGRTPHPDVVADPLVEAGAIRAGWNIESR